MGRGRARLTAAIEPSAAETRPPEPAPAPSAPGWPGTLAVFALAVVVRLLVARALASTVLYRSPQLDALEFVAWAKRILVAPLAIPAWPTHGLPYPYFLAGVFALGGSLAAARAAQAAIGGLTCCLVALAGGRLAGRRAGLAAGLCLAVYGPLVFEDTALWEEVLLLPLLAATLLALAADRRTALAASLGGLALGAATAVRPTVILLAPFAVAWLLWIDRWPRRGRAAAVFVAGWLAVVAPVVAAVSAASGGFVFVRGFGAVNLWIGNDPAGGGAQNARLGGAWDRLENAPFRAGARTPGEIERYFVDRARERAAADPAGLARVLASKVAWLVEGEEIRDNHSLDFFREASTVLRWLPGWGPLLALAAIGLPALDRRARRLLGGFALCLAVPVVVTLVGLRYRMPLLPAVAIVAGAGIARGVALAGRRAWRALLVALAIGSAVWGLSSIRRHPPTHVFAEEWALTGFSLENDGRYDEARGAYERARDADRESSLGWRGLGRLALRDGRLDEAVRQLDEAVRVDPDSLDARYDLGIALAALGRADEAIGEWAKVVELAPAHRLTDPALRRTAEEQAKAGRREAAEATLRALADRGHASGDDLRLLARLAAARGALADARDLARRSAAAEPDSRESWRLAGFLAAEAGDLDDLRRTLDRLRALPGADAVPERLLSAAAANLAGDRERADRELRELLARSRPPEAVALFLRNAREAGREDEARAFLAGLGEPGAARN
jgi:tetratricopeptide (TPR) repeat protein